MASQPYDRCSVSQSNCGAGSALFARNHLLHNREPQPTLGTIAAQYLRSARCLLRRIPASRSHPGPGAIGGWGFLGGSSVLGQTESEDWKSPPETEKCPQAVL